MKNIGLRHIARLFVMRWDETWQFKKDALGGRLHIKDVVSAYVSLC